MRWLTGLKAKLLAGGLLVLLLGGIASVAIVSLARASLEEQAFAQLRSVRETKATQIEVEVDQFLANLDTLAAAPSALDGLTTFAEAFDRLGAPIDQEGLDSYYTDELEPRIQGTQGSEGPGAEDATQLQPSDKSGRKLQDLYLANNPEPVGSKDELRDAKDGSDYSAVHAELHPFFRSALGNFGAYDIFLIDDQGTIVYSVFKEVDVGTNLKTGPYRSSGLASVWKQSVKSDELAVSDFEPYLPSYNAPAAFAAQGVYDSGKRVGTVAMQFPIDRINNVMTSEQRWSEIGLGESGETYLVADDLTMRNDSRFLIEDPDNYFSAIETVETPATVDLIKAFESTIGLQTVDTEGTQNALAGQSGELVFEDYRGVPVLSSYRPIDLGTTGLSWAIMSEIDEAEAFAPATSLITVAAAVLAITGLFLVVGIYWGASRITKPLRTLEGETVSVESFDFTGAQPYDASVLDRASGRRDEIGDLAGAFQRMTVTLGENVRARTEVEAELGVAAGIQQSMLPLTFPAFPENVEFQIHARLVPAKEIGGDFFEHGFIDPDHFFFTVGDVSGKGVPAALFMAAIKTLIRSGALQGESTSELLTRVNAELARENPEMMFATVWLGVLDLRSGEIAYTNAGHNPPVKITQEGVTWVEDLHGPMVGPLAGTTYGGTQLTLQPGESLVVYSDGVTEAMSPEQALYGEDRLAELLSGHANEEPKVLTQSVISDVLRWEDESERSDDVTVLVIRYHAHRREVELAVTLPFDGEQSLADAVVEDLSGANERIGVFAEQQGLPDEVSQRMQIGLDEIMVNIASYSGADSIVLRGWVDDQRLTVQVSDDGMPFNPLEIAAPQTDTPLEDRELGGLGIHVMRSLMSKVEYSFVGGRNVVTLVSEATDDGEVAVEGESP